MPKAIIIGGGLTGLAAAWGLERLGVDYTLIEVKRRLGGSIHTERRGGFTLDSSAFVLEKYNDWAFLPALGLEDALVPVGKYRDGDLVIFRDGTATLINALSQRITRPVMTRMAVSSVGRLENGAFGVCLENGLMLDARALIIAAPARYAEHMLRSLSPEAALCLLDYQYDPIVRVSLGYRREDTGEFPPAAPPIKFIEGYDFPQRVPPGHVLVRAGVRLDDSIKTPSDAVKVVKTHISRASPMMEWAAYWAEADSLMLRLPEHRANMDAIDALLPPGVALVGSDYRARCLDQRVEHGLAAAEKIAAYLQS